MQEDLIWRELYFSHTAPDNDWLIHEAKSRHPGTRVDMSISKNSPRTAQSVFDKYATEEADYAFSRTHVAVKLASYGAERLVSRSQAKRLLNGLNRFREVLLDFQSIDEIGQAFSDEIFRVFTNAHPNTRIIPINASEQVMKMIFRAMHVPR